MWLAHPQTLATPDREAARHCGSAFAQKVRIPFTHIPQLGPLWADSSNNRPCSDLLAGAAARFRACAGIKAMNRLRGGTLGYLETAVMPARRRANAGGPEPLIVPMQCPSLRAGERSRWPTPVRDTIC